MIFKNNFPGDKEWDAHISVLNEWTGKEYYLRLIIAYARSGPHYPKHMHQDLIEQLVAHERESEWNSAMLILRGMGVEFDGKEAWRIRKEWIASAAKEAERKQEAAGL